MSFSYCQLIGHRKYLFFNLSRGKYCLIYLEARDLIYILDSDLVWRMQVMIIKG